MTTQLDEPRVKQWSREEYYQLAEEGYFRGKRVQLIDGEIIEMAPQKHPHAMALSIVSRWARATFEPGDWVREQMPLNVGRASDPEPDVAVVQGPLASHTDHPTTALLIIEIADSSRDIDRKKSGLYASAAINEYWIVNIRELTIEVYREPHIDAGARFGHRYEKVIILRLGDVATPLVRPDATLAVADVFK